MVLKLGGRLPQHGDSDTKPRCTRNAPGLLHENPDRAREHITILS